MIDFIKQRKARLLTLPVQLFAAMLYYFGQPELAILLLMMSLIEYAAFVDAYRNGYLP
jgi:ABC-type microcin C transport system permease subunit YejE